MFKMIYSDEYRSSLKSIVTWYFCHIAHPYFILNNVTMFKLQLERHLHRCAWYTTFETHGGQIFILFFGMDSLFGDNDSFRSLKRM